MVIRHPSEGAGDAGDAAAAQEDNLSALFTLANQTVASVRAGRYVEGRGCIMHALCIRGEWVLMYAMVARVESQSELYIRDCE